MNEKDWKRLNEIDVILLSKMCAALDLTRLWCNHHANCLVICDRFFFEVIFNRVWMKFCELPICVSIAISSYHHHWWFYVNFVFALFLWPASWSIHLFLSILRYLTIQWTVRWWWPSLDGKTCKIMYLAVWKLIEWPSTDEKGASKQIKMCAYVFLGELLLLRRRCRCVVRCFVQIFMRIK